jgi:PPOX class probable F420-dependent enzyme
MTVTPPFARLADEPFVSLTTFRRTGEPVSTPVWVAREGEALVVTTPAASGKVKRLRRDPRVELRPCSRSGKVPEGAGPVSAVAAIEPPSDAATTALKRKYGLQYRAITTLERLIARRGRERVILRIVAG